MFKYFIIKIKEYIFVFSTVIILLFISPIKSFSDEKIFIVDNVEVEGLLDLNFSRDKYLDKAFLDSFEILMSKVLLTRDLKKISNIKLGKIKGLINSFQITEESYRNEEYKVILKIFYNDIKVKKFLESRNISFSQPTNTSAVFFPILFINGEIQDLNENYFYNQWTSVEINNELIDFVLPLEDLDDVSKLREAKKRIEELNVDDFVNKYDVKNYILALMHYKNNTLDIYLKINFNNSKVSKNISYEINDIRDELKLSSILKNLKIQITDIWKEENVVNLSIPLSIRIKFEYSNLKDLEKLKNTFYKISIIDKYSLEELNTKNSFFRIYYYGDPKRLQTELLKFDYQLQNDQVHWRLYNID